MKSLAGGVTGQAVYLKKRKMTLAWSGMPLDVAGCIAFSFLGVSTEN